MKSSNLLFDDDDLAGGRSRGAGLEVPDGYVGDYVLPGSGRRVWWTGRVAIGLMYRRDSHETTGQSAVWIQDLLLKSGQAAERRP